MKTRPSFSFEEYQWQQGVDVVVGIDEVGRGAFAGPVVVAAVAFPAFISSQEAIHGKSDFQELMQEVNDSKLLPPATREKLVRHITAYALFHTVVSVDVPVINAIGIGKATSKAMRKACAIAKNTLGTNSFFLVDGFSIPHVSRQRQQAIVRGDQQSISIAAASILAKVHRDAQMVHLSSRYPMYKFAQNKGYGTAYHQEALSVHGLSPLHRTSFDLQQFLS